MSCACSNNNNNWQWAIPSPKVNSEQRQPKWHIRNGEQGRRGSKARVEVESCCRRHKSITYMIALSSFITLALPLGVLGEASCYAMYSGPLTSRIAHPLSAHIFRCIIRCSGGNGSFGTNGPSNPSRVPVL